MKFTSLKKLLKLRKKIDRIDDKIINFLEKRFILTDEIKKYKNKTYDPKREEYILSKISSNEIKNIYLSIFKNSKKSDS